MKNTFGNSITLTIFGESHGPAIGCTIDGLAPGMAVDNDVIADLLSKRRPDAKLDTTRVEADEYSILSGVFQGRTTGTPLTIVIPNSDTHSSDYSDMKEKARPSHADFTANEKYHGFQDYRGGGHFSGRITAALVAAGGIFIPALEKKGISIKTEIIKCGTATSKKEINEIISQMKDKQDSIGGIVRTTITGVPAGVGEPWFDSLESLLSHAVFSIGGIKGIQFGAGFDFAKMTGSIANDPFYMDGDSVKTRTNNNGGINGGISNGMPIVFDCVVKPTPSISQTQETVNFVTKEDTELLIKGRHDPAIIRRISPVIDSVTSLVIADALTSRFGTDYLT